MSSIFLTPLFVSAIPLGILPLQGSSPLGYRGDIKPGLLHLVYLPPNRLDTQLHFLRGGLASCYQK